MVCTGRTGTEQGCIRVIQQMAFCCSCREERRILWALFNRHALTEETTDWAAHITDELLLGQGGCFPTLPRLPVILASAVSSGKFCKTTLLPLKHGWLLIQTDMIRYALLVGLRGWLAGWVVFTI